MNSYTHLFSPLKVNTMMLRNRIVVAPMGIIPSHIHISSTNYGGMSAWDRSMSGAALVFLGTFEDIFSKYNLDSTKERINVAKQDGCKVGVELGLFALPPDENGDIYGPSEGIRYDGKYCKEMSKKEMQLVIDNLVDQCIKAKKIGFDCIFLHFGHDSLLSQFMSPVWNKREDEYGGSVENRGRFPKEALIAVRNAVGKNFPLICRVSRQLIVPETFKEDDQLEFLKSIEDIVDMVNVSCGMDCYGGTVDKYEANVHMAPTIFLPHDYNKEFARRVKENTRLQVCLVGAVLNAREGEQLIKDGYADAIMYGRSMIADPYWPKKILNGQEDKVVPCIRCLNCYHVATEHWNNQCSVNPRFRRENRFELKPQYVSDKKRKKIMVIGGGVSGITAALAAKEAGHDVTLVEKNEKLGGLLNWACKGKYKEDLRNYYDYLIRSINNSGVNVILNCSCDEKMVREFNPDRLIIAVGSDSRVLNIQGKEKMIDALDVIDDFSKAKGKVVIIGSGSTGAELGLELAEEGDRDVTVLGMEELVAENGNWLYRIGLKQTMDKCDNLHFLNRSTVKEIDDKYVTVVRDNETVKLEYDTVINASGRVPKAQLASSFYGIVPDTITIGDAERPGAIIDATNIAYFVGRNS